MTDDYNGPRTQQEWEEWALMHGRPIPDWRDEWWFGDVEP
jgi:hypothetical protein